MMLSKEIAIDWVNSSTVSYYYLVPTVGEGMEIVERLLTKLNFSPNEAKVYCFLLEHNPINGYELSKELGTTRSTAYNVLDRLVEKELAIKLESTSTQYSPIPPEEFIRRYRSETDRTCEELREEFAKLDADDNSQYYIGHIQGMKRISKVASDIIDGSETELVLSMWSRDYPLVEASLKESLRRGVRVVVFSYTDMAETLASLGILRNGLRLHSYGFDENLVADIWARRRLTIISDHRLAFTGESRRHGKDLEQGIFTRNSMIIQICLEHVNLDILRLNHIRYGLGDFSETISNKEDYEKAIEILHQKMGIGDDDLPEVLRPLGFSELQEGEEDRRARSMAT